MGTSGERDQKQVCTPRVPGLVGSDPSAGVGGGGRVTVSQGSRLWVVPPRTEGQAVRALPESAGWHRGPPRRGGIAPWGPAVGQGRPRVVPATPETLRWTVRGVDPSFQRLLRAGQGRGGRGGAASVAVTGRVIPVRAVLSSLVSLVVCLNVLF